VACRTQKLPFQQCKQPSRVIWGYFLDYWHFDEAARNGLFNHEKASVV